VSRKSISTPLCRGFAVFAWSMVWIEQSCVNPSSFKVARVVPVMPFGAERVRTISPSFRKRSRSASVRNGAGAGAAAGAGGWGAWAKAGAHNSKTKARVPTRFRICRLLLQDTAL
jgi:hypothetical protein